MNSLSRGVSFIVLIVSGLLCVGCASAPVSCMVRATAADLPMQGLSAHRGGQLGCPENTLGAFARAVAQGVHQVEFDVRTTSDGALVVAHDDDLMNRTGPPLTISESLLEEVRTVSLGPCDGDVREQRVPTLGEALAEFPWNMWINLDMKEDAESAGRAIAREVIQSGRAHQVIFSARRAAARGVRRAARDAGVPVMISNMSRGFWRQRYVEHTIAACDAFIQLSTWRGAPSRPTMQQLADAGVRVNVSWLSECRQDQLTDRLRPLFRQGVNFVLVDHVAEAMAAARTLGIDPLVPQWKP